VVVQSQSVGDWNIEGFESALEGRDLPAGFEFTVLDKEGLSRRIQIVSDGQRTVGPMTSKVRVKLTHERVKSIEFFVYGVVESDVAFDTGNPALPDSISFDQMDPGSSGVRTLTITNKDPSTPYVLKSVEVQVPAPQRDFFEASMKTIEEGVSYAVELKARADMPEPFFRGSLVLNAEHPDVPRRIVTFHGFVRKS
jgi:hypothetical protein